MPQFELFLWAAPFFVLAVIIAALNDMTKKKGEGRATFRQAAKSVWSFFAITPLVLIIIGTFFVARKYLGPNGASLLLTVPILLLVGFVTARLFWPHFKFFLKTGSLPQRVTLQDGKPTMKCPQCARPVFLRPGKKGDFAYECEHCGHKLAWEKDISEAELKQALGIRDAQTPSA
jgi:hypothetical protein